MEPNRCGHRACAIIWPLWAGMLMGMPYLCSFDVAQGAVALGSAYVWVVLGLCLGLALGAHLAVRTHATHLRPIVFTAVGGTGCALALLLACGEWANAATSPITQIPTLTPQAVPLLYCKATISLFSSSPFGNSILHALRALKNFESPIAFCCALWCGLFGQALLARLQGSDRAGASSASHDAPRSPFLLLGTALLFLLGFLRPYAWLPFLPHSPFPLPRAFYDMFSPDQTWSPVGIVLAVPVLASALFAVGALGWVMASRAVSGNTCAQTSTLAHAFIPLCAGELAFRAASRVEPRLFQPPEGLVIAGAVVFACILVALALMFGRAAIAGWRHIFVPHNTAADFAEPSAAATAPSSPAPETANPITLETLRGALHPSQVTELEARGLTSNEIDAVRAHACALTSARAAELLGIRPSTLREYRRRASKKLGVSTLDETTSLMRAHTGEDSSAAPTTHNRSTGLATGLACCGLVALLALSAYILMPFGNALRSWDGIWVTAYGVGLGLALTAGSAALGWGKRLPAVLRVAGLLALAGSSAWLVATRLGWLAIGTASPASKALAILMFALFTASSLRCLYALALRAFPGSGFGGQPLSMRYPAVYPALFLAAVVVTGAAWEEVWRSRVYASPLMAFDAFLALVIAALGLVLWRCGATAGRTACLAAAAAAGATMPFEGFAFGLVLGAFVLLCVLGALVAGGGLPQGGAATDAPRKPQATMLRWAPLAGALGCCAGNWLVNAWGTLSSGTSVAVACVYVAAVLLGALGLACLVAAAHYVRSARSPLFVPCTQP